MTLDQEMKRLDKEMKEKKKAFVKQLETDYKEKKAANPSEYSRKALIAHTYENLNDAAVGMRDLKKMSTYALFALKEGLISAEDFHTIAMTNRVDKAQNQNWATFQCVEWGISGIALAVLSFFIGGATTILTAILSAICLGGFSLTLPLASPRLLTKTLLIQNMFENRTMPKGEQAKQVVAQLDANSAKAEIEQKLSHIKSNGSEQMLEKIEQQLTDAVEGEQVAVATPPQVDGTTPKSRKK